MAQYPHSLTPSPPYYESRGPFSLLLHRSAQACQRCTAARACRIARQCAVRAAHGAPRASAPILRRHGITLALRRRMLRPASAAPQRHLAAGSPGYVPYGLRTARHARQRPLGAVAASVSRCASACSGLPRLAGSARGDQPHCLLRSGRLDAAHSPSAHRRHLPQLHGRRRGHAARNGRTLADLCSPSGRRSHRLHAGASLLRRGRTAPLRG
jgi:hypothetical protein